VEELGDRVWCSLAGATPRSPGLRRKRQQQAPSPTNRRGFLTTAYNNCAPTTGAVDAAGHETVR
jgi:hypothetical protein